MKLDKKYLDRFWTYVNKSETCWIFTGTPNCTYPEFYCGKKYGHVRTHRLSYVLHKGRIPEGLMVLHSCDNPRCVNPSHLKVGTAADNIKDMYDRDRQNPGFKPGNVPYNKGLYGTDSPQYGRVSPFRGKKRPELSGENHSCYGLNRDDNPRSKLKSVDIDYIKEAMALAEKGNKLTTIRYLAKKFGVSESTIQSVIYKGW